MRTACRLQGIAAAVMLGGCVSASAQQASDAASAKAQPCVEVTVNGERTPS
jgi:hypothetical protein